MKTQLTAATGLARVIVAASEARGVDSTVALSQHHLSREHLDDPEARVSVTTLFELTERLARSSGDALFGLRAASFVDASSLGVLGFALRASSKVGDAFERFSRFSRLMNEGALTRVARATVFDGPRASPPWPRHYAELSMAALFVLVRKWTAQPLGPVEVGFQHPRPLEAPAVEAFFHCPVKWSQQTNRIAWPLDVLDVPFVLADRPLAVFLDRQLDQMTDALEAAPGALAAVRAEVVRQLASGPPTLEAVAHALGISSRTLQRRMRAHEARFEALVDSVRHDIAVSALRTPRVSIDEVSFRCGYSNARAFRRAFRRWTGVSPVSYQSELRLN